MLLSTIETNEITCSTRAFLALITFIRKRLRYHAMMRDA